MTESLFEAKPGQMKDEQLKKLHGQMKDEQLSAAGASQFKDICREMKKRGMSLSEKGSNDLYSRPLGKAKKGKGMEVDYASGMSSKRKIKKFKCQADYEKWFDKNEDDIEVFATRDLEEAHLEVECFPLEENSTENAKKSLQAILGMFKGHEDNDIYKMGKGIMDYYKKEGSFAPKHANWIWKTSVALFKK
jgi:hypothetical protein